MSLLNSFTRFSTLICFNSFLTSPESKNNSLKLDLGKLAIRLGKFSKFEDIVDAFNEGIWDWMGVNGIWFWIIPGDIGVDGIWDWISPGWIGVCGIWVWIIPGDIGVIGFWDWTIPGDIGIVVFWGWIWFNWKSLAYFPK